ncbi:MAG: DsbA family protein [Acidimicrobiia bacterium]
MSRDLEFVYVGDPMCSWCWGFAPVLERMQEVYDVPIRLVLGGLRPGPDAEELDDRLEQFLAHHWHQVEAASGQPFDHTFLKRRDGWRYDTELPAVAVISMRELKGAAVLAFHSRLQRAFYVEGVDITDPAAYPPLLEGFDVDRDKFMELLRSDDMKQRAWHDFAEARSLRVDGFPTLLLRDGEQWAIVTRGFAPADKLLPALSNWLLERFAEEGEGLFCEPGTVC